jgi:hypothetical protein
MPQIEGCVTVYESADGGSGNPVKTFWQYCVENGKERIPVTTENFHLAETTRLAIETSCQVRVSYNDQIMSQARLEYKYICEYHKVSEYGPNGNPVDKEICDARRLAP